MNPLGIAKAAGQVVGGLTNIASGIIGTGARRREQRTAQKEYDIARAAARNVDTSNLAANMQNAYEDMTVSTQAADFAAQQQQQAIANTMGCLLYTSPSPRDRTRCRMPSSA